MTVTLPATIEEAHAEIGKQAAEIERLRHENALLKKHLFGRRSERRPAPEESSDQLCLFETPGEADEAEAEREVAVPAHKRKKGGRRPLPKELPREEVVHDVSEEEKICSCGCEKHRMGEDVTEQIEAVPAKLYIKRHVRPKYVCRKCRSGVAQAPPPPGPIAKCLAGPTFLATMIVGKYGDHIPLCRMEDILRREGVDISRSNMSEWAMGVAKLCRLLAGRMFVRILDSDVIASDDTAIRVQQPGGGTKRSYLWVYLGDEKAPFTVFDFREGRSRAGPNAVLANYSGYLQADAYTGYDDLYTLTGGDGRPRILEVGCWAHARRRFVEAAEAGDKRARFAVDAIGQLYGVEREATKLYKEAGLAELHAGRLELRRERSAPLLDKLYTWMDERLDVLPQSPLGKAIGYAQNNRAALCRFAGDGRLAIDNNAAERALRPVAVGRKNWLFAGSARGGQAAAVFFSLIASARRHGLNPNEYLEDIFVRLPEQNIQKLDELLPDAWRPAA